MLWTLARGGPKVIFGGGTACERKDYLVLLKELIEAGEIKAVIDSRYPLEQTAEAHRHAESGRKQGTVVITVGHDDNP